MFAVLNDASYQYKAPCIEDIRPINGMYVTVGVPPLGRIFGYFHVPLSQCLLNDDDV